MNFFSHTFVAASQTREPAVALGAMLPDFAGMCGGRLADVRADAIASGVALHHATDRAFHQDPAFTTLVRETAAELGRSGMRRGIRLGAAHVAIELLLDGALAGTPVADALYHAALGEIRSRETRFDVTPGAAARRLPALGRRLAAHGVPIDSRDVGVVAARVERALDARPRLALQAGERQALRSALPVLATRVCSLAPGLVDRTIAAVEDLGAC